ncbi:MAG TPA: 16S rRNA (uracil(1498)-N(3))-methyltransferase [Rhodospirillaceae bacterium]|nr:16S rRNA (uracil(1498)-N(3))-methyltransferase [Rhodospirillaceae bacterium]
MEMIPKLRLFVDADLRPGAALQLGPEQAHYLLHVMRAEIGTAVALFNGRDGEWRAQLVGAGKRTAGLAVGEQLRCQAPEPDLWLLFAPVKRDRIDLIVEKATELGVGRFCPVLTQHSAVTKVNPERLQAIAIEAAEQSRRLTVPRFEPVRRLADSLADWPEGRCLLVMDERGGGEPLVQALDGLVGARMAVLVGPEGGFAQSELDALRRLAFAKAVGLGPRILRADTAVAAALSCFQALCGDWRGDKAGS